MHAQPAARVAPARRHPRVSRTLPVLVGVAFGMYAWFLDRDQEFTTSATVVGLASGVAAMAVVFALLSLPPAVPRELRALAYGSALGAGIGYLHSLSGGSVLTAVILGLLVGAGLGAAVFYAIYTHED